MSEQTEIRLRAAVWPLVGAAVLTVLTLAVWFHEHFASAEDLDELRPRMESVEKKVAVQGAVMERVESSQHEMKQDIHDLVEQLRQYPIERHR
jgi:septal ring factor EnvC (AmiA/AmiB activator)